MSFGLLHTDFRFNTRILSLLELDQAKVKDGLNGELKRRSSSGSVQAASSSIKTRAASPKPEFRTHEVQPLDSLESVARLYKIDTATIRMFNGLNSRSLAGLKVLKIPPAGTDTKKLKEELLKQRKEKKSQKLKTYISAFQQRTFVRDSSKAEDYLKKAKHNYYDAIDNYYSDLTAMNKAPSSAKDLKPQTPQKIKASKSLLQIPSIADSKLFESQVFSETKTRLVPKNKPRTILGAKSSLLIRV